MKKTLSAICAAVMLCGALTACGGGAKDSITVISREDGSGTRGAFIELTGVEQKDADGKKQDKTIDSAVFVNSTSVVITQVQENKSAIGYISLGSLNDTVKAVSVEGIEATAANVENGSYKIARPFNIATKGEVSAEAQDFINYILSDDGAAVISGKGYIPVSGGAYTGTNPSGKIVIGGSTSVAPVMEKLVEAYKAVNPDVTIEIQTSDSSSGMKLAAEGTLDIGMASRGLKDSELETLTPTTIAMDGIALIVNKENTVTNLTVDQIKGIYTGEITEWSAVK